MSAELGWEEPSKYSGSISFLITFSILFWKCTVDWTTLSVINLFFSLEDMEAIMSSVAGLL